MRCSRNYICNEFPAYFGNVENYVRAFPKKAALKLLLM